MISLSSYESQGWLGQLRCFTNKARSFGLMSALSRDWKWVPRLQGMIHKLCKLCTVYIPHAGRSKSAFSNWITYLCLCLCAYLTPNPGPVWSLCCFNFPEDLDTYLVNVQYSSPLEILQGARSNPKLTYTDVDYTMHTCMFLRPLAYWTMGNIRPQWIRLPRSAFMTLSQLVSPIHLLHDTNPTPRFPRPHPCRYPPTAS